MVRSLGYINCDSHRNPAVLDVRWHHRAKGLRPPHSADACSGMRGYEVTKIVLWNMGRRLDLVANVELPGQHQGAICAGPDSLSLGR